ncbi:hypothetical protein ACFQ3S_08465 [Mucilaginibacter terrae]|uniref:hypothetical protein n=1 Tax=Mucilaginibacter terrae TaxID=1955052 RepID=UPI00363AD21C
MPDIFSKSVAIKLKVLGWYQIIGGAIGVLLTIWLLARTQAVSGLLILLFMVAFCLYGLSITAGKKLLGSQYDTGLKLSIINQMLQVFSFLFLGYGFMYVSGLVLSGNIKYNVGEDGNGLRMGVDFGLFSKWNFDINSNNRSFLFSMNFLAVYLLYFIYRLRQRINFEFKQYQLLETENDADESNSNDNEL